MPLLVGANTNMTMPVGDVKWQMVGKRGRSLLLHGLLAGVSILALSAAAHGQDCLYVISRLRGTVEAYHRPELSLVASVPLPDCPLNPPTCMPTAVEVDPLRRRAYITRQDAGNVQVLDMSGFDDPLAVAVGTSPSDAVLTDDGNHLWVSNLASDSVSVIDTVSDQVVATIPVGDGPRGLDLSPDGRRLYVANGNDDSLSIIDTGTRQVIDTIAVGDEPTAVKVAPNGTFLYVSNARAASVSVVDLPDHAVRSIAVGTRPRGIAFLPDSSTAYVTNTLNNTLSPVDTDSELAASPIAVGNGPIAIVISDNGQTGYIANVADTVLSVLDVASGDVSGREEQGSAFDVALGSCPLLPTPTVTVTPTSVPTFTATPGAGCAGDCNGDGMVPINELISGVNIALGNAPVSTCEAFDVNGDGEVTINELIAAVNAALNGC